eukprot:6457085-Amphidinium_carterae.1
MENGDPLLHVDVDTLTGSAAKGVAFVGKEQAAVAFAAHANTTECVVLLLESELHGHRANRTQLMARDLLGARKVIYAWVLVAGQKAVTVAHPATEVTLATGEASELRVMAHAKEMDPVAFAAFQQRGSLHQFIGTLSNHVYVKASFQRDTMHGRMHTYLVEVTRSHVLALLAVSGKQSVTVGSSERLDRELGLTTVYTDGQSLSSLLQRLGGAQHAGIVGPLRRGGYLVRCQADGVEAVRKTLTPNDPRFSRHPALVVHCRYRARVSQDITPIQLAASLDQSLSWPCVGLSTQRSGGNRNRMHVVVLGASREPPETQILLKGYLVRLERMQESDSQEVQTTTFKAPTVEARVHTVPDAITGQIRQQQSTLENVIQAKLGDAQAHLQ